MIGLLVVTHGKLAEELVNAAKKIVGEIEALEALAMEWDLQVDDAGQLIEEAIQRVDQGSGVLLLTDMFGGTPTNLALSLHEQDRIEIVTGANLPMLIKFMSLRENRELRDVAAQVAEQGQQSIQVASQLLEPKDEGGDS